MPDHELTTIEALSLWQRVLSTAMDSLDFDYSVRQLGILLIVYLQPGPHTVKSLSSQLGVSKAAICRGIDALSINDWLRRRKDTEDRRNVFIQRTIKGSVLLSDFADIIIRETRPMLNAVPVTAPLSGMGDGR